jgi:CMP-N-acetylneuraminic acid synthetase
LHSISHRSITTCSHLTVNKQHLIYLKIQVKKSKNNLSESNHPNKIKYQQQLRKMREMIMSKYMMLTIILINNRSLLQTKTSMMTIHKMNSIDILHK